ncbi:hypothetical protein [Advenella mimigardefordensis]|uniref:Uncharacterized protein n=1 Tax=Advenella mimigardefordensis (strain DSM 17166 / LMG 22922 / DPN7) TaxID=1247726 RepID=W0PCS7_ADVMD|nr:hypothetical protein [Advenella mimigardefordensis]AHG63200.1 hypothetical protein MIM_c11020 [Advenella mimigardefordensis DPN7]
MNELFGRIWGYIAGAAALIVAAAGLYLRGRSTGRSDERQERDAAVAKQQAQAQKITRKNANETNMATDDAVDAELERDWMRKP